MKAGRDHKDTVADDYCGDKAGKGYVLTQVTLLKWQYPGLKLECEY